MSVLVYSSKKGNPVTDSRRVAKAFGRSHKSVLVAWRRLVVSAAFRQAHYEQTTYTDGRGREQPLVRMSAEGEQELVNSFTARRADLTATQTYLMLAQGVERVKIGQAADVPTQLAALQCACPVPLVLLATLPGSQKAKLHQRFAHLATGGSGSATPPTSNTSLPR